MEHPVGVNSVDGSGEKAKKLRLVFVPLPGMGHLVAMVEFAKRLLRTQDASYQLDITFINIQFSEPRPQVSSYIASVTSSGTDISFLNLPPVKQVPNFMAKTPEASLTAFVDLHIPLVRSALQDMMASDDTPIIALVVDLFCTSMIDIANELGIHPYAFFTSSAGFLGLMLHASSIISGLPAVEDEDEGFLSSKFHGKTVQLPGFTTPFPLQSMPLPLSNPKDDAFSTFAIHTHRLIQAKGIVVNTFYELEPKAMKALEEGFCLPTGSEKRPPTKVYAVGPILSLESANSEATATSGKRDDCIRWLDEQAPRSVVFLCFGSMGSFAAAQAKEIAVGLEQSGQPFLWVLRSTPAQAEQHQGRRPVPKDADLEELLPDGFLERTKARGLVWPSFAPQRDILAHAAIGGFVTHCGWNSCLESIWFGVPMAAWPLYAEQHFNAFEMVTEMGVALKVGTDRKACNAATADEVKRAVTALMGPEGAGVRRKTEQMKKVAMSVFDKGGSSFHAIHSFVQNLLAAVE